jgi:hypothetical protein
MKKLVSAVLAVVFLSATAAFAAPEISLRAGLDVAGKMGLDVKTSINDVKQPALTVDGSEDASTGFSIGAEILFPIAHIVKVGGGIAYLPDREVGKSKIAPNDKKMTVGAVPIYATVQVNPIPLNGLYFKGNIGLSILMINNGLEDGLHIASSGEWDATTTFYGIYASIGAGYEFPFGLFAELAYDIHSANQKDSVTISSVKFELDGTYTYTKLGLTVGYKFKL